ncbi:MAG: hypothetical protein Q9191_001815 [Dirinaria sp. TL-2023a]
MADLSRQSAREIIEDIMISHGGITAEDRAVTKPSVLRSLASVRESLAKATTTLSNQLYSKDTRFVYELIQNAEDNTYNICKARGVSPGLIFTVAPDLIIIDSNEDGFTENDVRALCELGGSTKTASGGFIGEKGIGFKSVFKIASRVRIQSGPFCFAFEYGKDDDGLGMVTPINDEHEKLPKKVRTRFTLTLNGHVSFDDLVHEFNGLPDTLLLFLTKLKRITIRVPKVAGLSNTVYTYTYDETLQIGTVVKSESMGESSKVTSRQYYVERRVIKDLPADKARPHTSGAEVVLAFPVNEESRPIIEQQHVFAFVPMRRVGFNFQIQSDFVVQASREDILDSAWNNALLDGVAATFRQAVLHFRRNHPLEFSWIRFLPSDHIPEPFWARLRGKILEYLRHEEVLQTWNADRLARAAEIRLVPPDFLDANGKPLFSSLAGTLHCISSDYSRDDTDLLTALGVQTLSSHEFCHRLSFDLDFDVSRFKSNAQSDFDWNTRTARKLLAISESDFAMIQEINLIPLQDGTWTSASTAELYFPEYQSVPVPSDIGLRLVDKDFLSNAARRELYYVLGVEDCLPNLVISKIRRRYNTDFAKLGASVSHIRWLYHFLPEEQRGLDRLIPLFAHDGVPTYRARKTIAGERRVCDLYFETEDEFGVKELCREQSSIFPKKGVTQYEVYFINEAYLNAVEPMVLVHGMSWLNWLEDSAGVRRIPRLVRSVDSTKISNLFSWLVSNRPGQVVETLHAYWYSYKDQMKPEIIKFLREAKVLWRQGKEIALGATWIPTPELVKICEDYGSVRKGRFSHSSVVAEMPFLDIRTRLNPQNQGEWRFLAQFGVSFDANTFFYLEALRVLRTDSRLTTGSFPKKLGRVYEAIEKSSNSSNYEKICELFARENLILAPSQHNSMWIWVPVKDCFWEAPAFIDNRNVLGSHEQYQNNQSIKHLFNGILAIPDSNSQHYIEQLTHWKDRETVGDVVEVYHHLLQATKEGMKSADIRQSFEAKKLVYLPSQTSKKAIAAEFPELQDFFICVLGVQEPDKSTYIMELATLCREESAPSIAKVKSLLRDINSWQPLENDLDILKTLDAFPVKDPTGTLRLRCIEHTFVLFDRLSHAETFKGKVAWLDFDIEEMRSLRHLIKVLHLDARYTSRLVNEETRAQDAILDPSLSEELRYRAHAIFRVSTKHGDSLYQRLQRADVRLTNSISSTTKLILSGTTIASASTISRLHLQDEGDQISLYVPRNEREKELSYLTKVPERMMAYFGIKDRGAAKVFGDVVRSSRAVLDDVLESHGIMRLPGLMSESALGNENNMLSHVPNSSSRPESETEVRGVFSAFGASAADTLLDLPAGTKRSSERARSTSFGLVSEPMSENEEKMPSYVPKSSQRSDTETGIKFGFGVPIAKTRFGLPMPDKEDKISSHVPKSSSGPGTDISVVSLWGAQASKILLDLPADTKRSNERARSASPARATGLGGVFGVEQPSQPKADRTNERYRALLDHVIKSAHYESDQVGFSNEIFVPDDVFGTRSTNQMLHDMKMGAAGELFVFEFLLDILSPSLSRANWRSKIRKHVCVHEKYSDMTSYEGTEKADIIYDDVDGKFTDYLIRHDKLDQDIWIDQKPRYFLEVKTTMQKCETRFLMSKAQVQRMERMVIPPGESTAEVYVIARVSNLGQKGIDLDFIVDPETQRRNKQLRIEAESYRILHSCALPE